MPRTRLRGLDSHEHWKLRSFHVDLDPIIASERFAHVDRAFQMRPGHCQPGNLGVVSGRQRRWTRWSLHDRNRNASGSSVHRPLITNSRGYLIVETLSLRSLYSTIERWLAGKRNAKVADLYYIETFPIEFLYCLLADGAKVATFYSAESGLL